MIYENETVWVGLAIGGVVAVTHTVFDGEIEPSAPSGSWTQYQRNEIRGTRV
jgi:hypothetical protein